MAVINIHGNKMIIRMTSILGFLNSEAEAETKKYEDEIFLIGVNKSSELTVGAGLTASELQNMASIPLEIGETGQGPWLKRPKTFGLERKILVVRGSAPSGDNYLKISNKLKAISANPPNLSVPQTYNPIFIYQAPDKKIDHLLFVKVFKVETSPDQYSYIYNIIMELQITPTGTQDSTYGNLYHLKHLTFTFS